MEAKRATCYLDSISLALDSLLVIKY